MWKKFALIVLIIFLGACMLAVFAGFMLYRNYNRPSQASFPNPWATVHFPAEPTQYPADWPEDLKYPKEFILVDIASGTLIEGAPKGYSAQLRFKGKSTEAIQKMTEFLEEKGWTVVDNTLSDSGDAVLIFQRGNGQGLVDFDVDPNDSSQTLITATFSP